MVESASSIREENTAGGGAPGVPQRPIAGGRVRGTMVEPASSVSGNVRDTGSGSGIRTPREAQQADQSSDEIAFRPVFRPPIALLCLLDDGDKENGEWIRLRAAKTIIGRSEGDVIIPHDDGMSGQHAEISRRAEGGRYRWYLKDLNSTNGTFVRVSRAGLKHQPELIIGSRRYRFELPTQGAAAAALSAADTDDDLPKGTRGWRALTAGPVNALFPSLIELTPQGDGQRFPIRDAEHWVGRDPARCSIVLRDDPFVGARHARIFRDPQGRWKIESEKTLNGVWLRIEEVPLDSAGEFQLGEQRFKIRFP